MMNFVNFCKRFHDQISSEESHCEVTYFIDSTLGFLMEDHFFVVVAFLGKK